MSYIFINTETLEVYSCKEDEWKRAFNFACEDGWVPDGTEYDLECQVMENCSGTEEPDYDEKSNLFYVLVSMNELTEWDGNYFERKNQIVTGVDAYYMVLSLECGDFSPDLLEFMKKGSFRISSD